MEARNLTYPATAVPEHRSSFRRAICVRADVRLPDGTVLVAHSTDISESGIGLMSPQAVGVDEDCHIAIRLAVCGTDHYLTLVGRVCYCIDKGQYHRIGLRFVALDPESRAALIALLPAEPPR